MHDDQVTLAILAGGKGRRMGAAKDRLSIGGRPILLHLLDRIAHGGPTLLVASPERPRPLGADAFDRVVLDSVEDAGPLAGISAALLAAQTPVVVVLSIDMPHITGLHVGWLVEQLQAQPLLSAVLLRRRDGDGTRSEPFPAVYRKSAATVIDRRLSVHTSRQTALEQGRSAGSLYALSTESGFQVVDAPSEWPDETWLNLNRPQDLWQIDGEIA